MIEKVVMISIGDICLLSLTDLFSIADGKQTIVLIISLEAVQFTALLSVWLQQGRKAFEVSNLHCPQKSSSLIVWIFSGGVRSGS